MMTIKQTHTHIELWGTDPATIAHAEKLRSKYGYRVTVVPHEREYQASQLLGNIQKINK